MPAEDVHQRLTLHVTGRVQGVGFRQFTRSAARTLNLTGWVCNAYDGSVEAVAEGPRTDLERFLHQVRQGPRTARVDRVDADWSKATGAFQDFSVRF